MPIERGDNWNKWRSREVFECHRFYQDIHICISTNCFGFYPFDTGPPGFDVPLSCMHEEFTVRSHSCRVTLS